jgi:ABC-type multidrug transport system fused ATPase/permease subunit
MGKSVAAATRIFKILENPSKINAVEINKDPSKQRLNLETVRGEIEFRNVWFRYPTRKEKFVLKDFSLKVEPGQSIALVGESGCGKSTFVSLLMRFYDVDEGEVLFDGINIKDLNLYDLRTAISLVMQEPVIFNYSILENVLYGKLDATNSEVEHYIREANALEFIEKDDFGKDDKPSAIAVLKMWEDKVLSVGIKKLTGDEKYAEELEVLKTLAKAEKKKMFVSTGDIDSRDRRKWDCQLSPGFDLVCGVKGSKLSGGQKQRIAIARTIIRAPKVLLLDEATSALDEDSQRLVQDALEKSMKGRTTVIIAHRLSTIEKCEKIYVLEEGTVCEEGSFNELKNMGGQFSKIT